MDENKNEEMKNPGNDKKKGKLRRLLLPIVLIIVLMGCGAGYYFWSQSTGYFITDNAKVTAKMYTITPIKAGQILEWNIANGDEVRKNQILGSQDTLPHITSPIDGQVVKNDAAVGQSVASGAQLAVIADIANMYIGVNIEETDITEIRLGQETEVTIDAYKGEVFRGLITDIDMSTQTFFNNSPSLSTSGTYTKVTQLVPVKVHIDNPRGLPLAFGMNATVKVKLRDRATVVWGDKSLEPLVAVIKAGYASNQDIVNTGNLEASEAVKISPDISGRVKELYAKLGAQVRKDDVLFTLDSTETELQLKQAEAAYNAASVAYRNSRSLQGGSSLVPAQVAFDEAKRNYERILSLFNEGAVAQSDLDAAKARMETAEAQLSTASTQSGTSVDTAAAQLSSAQAALDIARQRLENCTVKATMDGEVLSVAVREGDMASPQSAAVTLIDTSKVILKVAVAESRIGQIGVGMPVEVVLQAKGGSLPGTVSKIAPGVNPATGMFDVEIEAVNRLRMAEAGMAAEVRFDTKPPTSGSRGSGSGMDVPSQAVFGDDYGISTSSLTPDNYVFVMNFTESEGNGHFGVIEKRSVHVFDRKGGTFSIDNVEADEYLVFLSPKALSEGESVSYVVVNR